MHADIAVMETIGMELVMVRLLKRLFALLALLAMMTSMAACGNSDTDSDSKDSESTSQSPKVSESKKKSGEPNGKNCLPTEYFFKNNERTPYNAFETRCWMQNEGTMHQTYSTYSQGDTDSGKYVKVKFDAAAFKKNEYVPSGSCDAMGCSGSSSKVTRWSVPFTVTLHGFTDSELQANRDDLGNKIWQFYGASVALSEPTLTQNETAKFSDEISDLNLHNDEPMQFWAVGNENTAEMQFNYSGGDVYSYTLG